MSKLKRFESIIVDIDEEAAGGDGRMSGELKPCPLCGGEADTAERYDGIWTAFCTRCGCETGFPASCDELDEAEAAALWNTRSDHAVQSANDRRVENTRIAELETLVRDMESYIEEFAAFSYHTKEKAMFGHIAITERMAELGIGGR